ncbi:putative molybdopterin-guanine dinucleotide biosynthesis protein MobD [Escherichia phage JLBYU24]|nr:putative molybdopterin-guanine dinucleotide biosynthesis protein MobD [Escherichia phage JLBYU24]
MSTVKEKRMKILFVVYVMIQYNYPMFTYNLVNNIIDMIQRSIQ